MARLTAAERKGLKASQYALPKLKKYPIEDVGHARAAKSRLSEQYHARSITRAQFQEGNRRADRVIEAYDKKHHVGTGRES